MTLHWIDHLFIVLLVAVFPVFDFFVMRRYAARIDSGETDLKAKLYRKVLVEEWLAVGVLVGTWAFLGRPARELGLVPQWGWEMAVGSGVAAAICVAVTLQWKAIQSSPENQAKVHEQIAGLSFLLPTTPDQRRAYDWMAVTAGVCEEVLFRGFVMAYLMAALPVSVWTAALASAAVFGIAHTYQGLSGIVRTALLGLVVALLYAGTGSIWASVIVHAVIDLTSGRVMSSLPRNGGRLAAEMTGP